MNELSPELLEILVCPESHQSVKLAEEQVVVLLKDLQQKGTLKNRAGGTPQGTISGALVREDGKLIYPIIEGIPVMLLDEAIEADQLSR